MKKSCFPKCCLFQLLTFALVVFFIIFGENCFCNVRKYVACSCLSSVVLIEFFLHFQVSMGYTQDERTYNISGHWNPTEKCFEILNTETEKGHWINCLSLFSIWHLCGLKKLSVGMKVESDCTVGKNIFFSSAFAWYSREEYHFFFSFCLAGALRWWQKKTWLYQIFIWQVHNQSFQKISMFMVVFPVV